VAPSVQRRKVWLTLSTRCRAVTLTRHETRWNLQGFPKLANRSQPLVGQSSPYYEDMWRTYRCLTSFFPIVDTCLSCEDIAYKIVQWCPHGDFLHHFCVLYFRRAGHVTCVLVWSKSDWRRLRKTLHKQTNKQTNRHYENNGRLAVNQKSVSIWQSYGREHVERSCLNTVANGPGFSSATLCSTCVVLGMSSHFARVRCSAECSAAMSSFTCSISAHLHINSLLYGMYLNAGW